MTPRPAEAIMFGSIPVGLAGHAGVEEYCPLVASDPSALRDTALTLAAMPMGQREQVRRGCAEALRAWDAAEFARVLEDIAG
jgi:hypothetical protein